MRAGPPYPFLRTTQNSFRGDQRNRRGLGVSKPSQQMPSPSYPNISLAEDERAPLKAQEAALLNASCFGESAAGGAPPRWRDCRVSKRVQEERQKETSRQSCFPSRAGSLYVVVEDGGVHLGVSGWRHELELGSIHEDRAVLRAICVI